MKTRAVVAAFFFSLAGVLSAAQKPHWPSYKSTLLNIQISVPSDWKPLKMPKMLAFRYDDPAGGMAGIGILKSTKITSIDDASNKELQVEGHPADWNRSNSKIGGMRAIKISGTDKTDSSKRFVHYYVETPGGVYILQCQGSAARWPALNTTFAAILGTLTFL